MRLEEQIYFSSRDLENLSSSVMYSFQSRPLEEDLKRLNNRDSYGIIPQIVTSPKLTIRDFPASGFQLHIHEGENGTAHIWDYKRQKKFNISSYDAAIMDLTAKGLNEDEEKLTKEEIDRLLREE